MRKPCSWLLCLLAVLVVSAAWPSDASAQSCIEDLCDTTAPTIKLDPPLNNSYAGPDQQNLAVRIEICDAYSIDESSITITRNGTSVASSFPKGTGPTGSWCKGPSGTSGVGRWWASSNTLTLVSGSNLFSVRACDFQGNCRTTSVSYYWDPNPNYPPSVSIWPTERVWSSASVPVSISWSDTTGLDYGTRSITVNGVADAGWTHTNTSATRSSSTKTVTLNPGTNTINVTIRDVAGLQGTASRTYVYDTSAPTVTITSPTASSSSDSLRTITVGFSDAKLDLNSSRVGLNGRDVTESLTLTWGIDETTGERTGTLPMAMGENVVEAEICDSFQRCTTSTATFVRHKGLAKQAPVLSVAHHPDYRVAGGATVSYTTPAYVSLDAPRAVTLLHVSGQARPMGWVQVDAADYSSTPPEKMSLTLRNTANAVVPLLGGMNTVFYSAGSGSTRLTAQFDASALATGSYQYTAVVDSWFAGDATPVTATIPVRVIVINEKDSPYGWGWTLAGVSRLKVQSDGVLLLPGDGSAAFFAKDSCFTDGFGNQDCFFRGPDGDFTSMEYLQPGPYYLRTHPNGTQERFGATGLLESVRDRFGNTATFAYSSGRLTGITDPAGKTITVGYTTAGRLNRITDPAGRAVTFEITVNSTAPTWDRNLWRITDPDGVVALQVGYNGSHQAVHWNDRAGARTDVAYHPRFLTVDSIMAPVRNADGMTGVRPTTHIRSLAEVTYPATGTTSSTSPAPRVRPTDAWVKVTDAKGDSSTFVPDRFGNPMLVRDDEGRIARALRDAHGRDTVSISAKGDTVRTTWAGANLTRVYRRKSYWVRTDSVSGYWGGAEVAELEQNHGAYGIVTYRTGSGGTAGYWYGAKGQLDSMWVGYPVDRTRFTTDTRGRTLSVTDPEGHVTSYTYQTSGFQNTATVHGPTGTTTFGYDAFGRQTTVTGPTGLISRVAYDTLNRVRSSTDPASRTVTNTYGAFNGSYLTAVTDPKGQVYHFHPNQVGQDTAQVDPDLAGRWMTYDRNGNVLTARNARGQVVETVFDPAHPNRPTEVRVDGQAVQWYEYDPDDLWTVVRNAESTDTIFSDTLGRVVKQVTVRNGQRYAVTSGFDWASRRTDVGLWTPASSHWPHSTSRYNFDPAKGRLTSISAFTGDSALVRYNEEDMVSRVVLPTAGKDSMTFSYTSAHGLASIRYPGNSTLNAKVGVLVTRDSLGRVTQRMKTTMDSVRTFGYDNAGQLTSYKNYYQTGLCSYQEPVGHTCVGGTSTLLLSQAYTYDLAGNRTSHGGVVTTGNRMTSGRGYNMEYDADGNMVRKYHPTNGYDLRLYWNALGQMDSARHTSTTGVVTRASYGYDGFGRRVRRTVGGATVQYVYDGSEIVLEANGSGAVSATYANFPGTDAPYAMRTAAGAVYYFVRDERGSVVGLVDQNGTLTNEYRYSPWGEAEYTRQNGPNLLRRFTGRELDVETGLYYYRARYYDPVTARFVSKDPIGLAGGINPYAYVGNDPVNSTDPSGLCEESMWFPTNQGNVYRGDQLVGLNVCAWTTAQWDAFWERLWDSPLFVRLDMELPYTQRAMSDIRENAWDATHYWAERHNATGNFGPKFAGWVAAAGTEPELTASVLGLAAGANGWTGRPYWRYVGPVSDPAGPWMTRGWGRSAPYGTNYAAAAEGLALPHVPTGVVPVRPNFWEPMIGPRTVKPKPQWGRAGGGTEYFRLNFRYLSRFGSEWFSP